MSLITPSLNVFDDVGDQHLAFDAVTLTGRCISLDPLVAEERQSALKDKAHKLGGLICVQEEIPEYEIRPKAYVRAVSKGLKTKLWFFQKCNFEESLALLDIFRFLDDSREDLREALASQFKVPLWDPSSRSAKLKQIKSVLIELNSAEKISIQWVSHTCLRVGCVQEPTRSWSQLVSKVKRFNESEFNQVYDGPGDSDMWRVFKRRGLVTIPI